jgi:hypothetical protein
LKRQEARSPADVHASRTPGSAILVNDGANATMRAYVVKRELRKGLRKTV